MVRINLVPPSELMDQHLIAEHNEILMLVGALQRTLSSKQGLVMSKIPSEFTLGKGHIYFFFNKGAYIDGRFYAIREEMKNRGFTSTKTFPIHLWPLLTRDSLGKIVCLHESYVPDCKALKLARDRIALRISQKPGWYKYRGKKLEDINAQTCSYRETARDQACGLYRYRSP